MALIKRVLCFLASIRIYVEDNNAEAHIDSISAVWIAQTYGSALAVIYAYNASNTAGHTKKVTTNAVLLMSFCLGNILGPLTFRDKDAPLFVPAKVTIVSVDSFAIATTAGLLCYYMWQNKRRDRAMAGIAHEQDIEFADLTDRENLEFRYKY